MEIKKAVITGGTSMLGAALARELSLRGSSVVCVVRPESKKIDAIPVSKYVSAVECPLSGLSGLPSVIGTGFDAFFHFAWDGTMGAARNDSVLQAKNIEWTVAACGAAKELGCRVFVGAGSQAEYGRTEDDLSPDTPVRPETAYGAAKLAAGLLSRIACRKSGIKHVWARVLSVYGPYDNENTLMSSCIRAFLAGEKMLFTQGRQLWDYLYCGDAARAFRLMAEKGTDGAVYTLGSGTARPLSEYVLAARKTIGNGCAVFGGIPYPKGQVMRLKADISALVRDTGFEPKTEFYEGVGITAKWWKDSAMRKS